jgi:hypothetical protein
VKDSIVLNTAIIIVFVVFFIGVGVIPGMAIFSDDGDRLIIAIVAFIVGFYHTKHWPSKAHRKHKAFMLNDPKTSIKE